MTEEESTGQGPDDVREEPLDASSPVDSTPEFRNPGAALAPGLYLVATPIGNLEDLTLRALRVLRSVDRIACEDTRQTARLLGHFGIQTPTVSYHAHNEASRAAELVQELKAGGRIAVVSDAGTPGIADPGATIAAQAIAEGIPVFPIPGANAALTGLIASGLSAERFTFHGFLPAREGQRRSTLEALQKALVAAGQGAGMGAGAGTEQATPETHIFYETPHRILDSLAEIAAVFGPLQRIVIARELTKLHEEFLRGTAAEVLAELGARPRVRGEMVLLIEGRAAPSAAASSPGNSSGSLAGEVAALMQTEGLSEKESLKRVARARGIGKSEAYREWQRSQSRKR